MDFGSETKNLKWVLQQSSLIQMLLFEGKTHEFVGRQKHERLEYAKTGRTNKAQSNEW